MILVLAEASTAVFALMAVGSLILSGIIAGRKKNKSTDRPLDEPSTSFAERNATIPTLYGRRRVGVHFTSVWGRTSREETVGSSGSGGKGLFGSGGGGGAAQTVWYESSIQCICSTIGKLHGVYESNATLFESTAGQSPDGDGKFLIDLGDAGSGTLYYGTPGTPVRAVSRAQGTGEIISQSRWEGLCAIEWHYMRLGGSPTWRQYEFDVSYHPADNRLSNSDYLVRPSTSDAGDEGINAAHFIYQVLTLPFPFGLGMDENLIDKDSLEAVGEVCETEGLGVNLLITENIKTVLDDVMTMCDIVVSERNGKLHFGILREITVNPPSLFGSVILDSAPEVTASLEHEGVTRATLTYRNKDLNWERDSSSVTDDGSAERSGGFKTINLATEAFTERTMIESILARKAQQGFGDKQLLTISAARGALTLFPGDAVSVEGFGGSRIVSANHDLRNSRVDLELMLDTFNVPAVSIDLPDWSSSLYREAEPDIAFNWFELPPEDSQGRYGLGIMRLRKHIGIIGANVWIANASGIYRNVGSQNTTAFGGQIQSAISISAASPIVNGPIFEATDFERADIDDLSGDSSSWRNGFLLCLINREVFFIEKIERQTEPVWAASTPYTPGDSVVPAGVPTGLRYVCIVGGTSGTSEPEWPLRRDAGTFTDGGVTWTTRHFEYQIKNMIRAQYETLFEDHSIGDYCFIIPRTRLNNIVNPVLDIGATMCVKTQPFTRIDIVDLADVTSVCEEFTGVGDPSVLLVDEDRNFIVTETGSYIRLR